MHLQLRLMVTLPSAEDFDHPEIGPLLRRYVEGATGSEEERRRVLRLVETMTIGAVAVALRTESMHGAGSPQAQRIQIVMRSFNLSPPRSGSFNARSNR